jgi:DNA-binding winged helix-turn-helix (wHTH) protein
VGDGADVVTGDVEPREVGGKPFRIGRWLVEPSLNRLSKDDTTIQLELKVMDVLVCLAERAGEVVPRQEIVDRVWATEFISDNTLTHAITELRNALGDDARNPSFIETIHRRGYRLIAPVEATVSDEAGESKVARFPVRERAVSPEVERSPYPGLAAFTEDDAEFFFGREAEVALMWRKLTSRKLLAVIGPSGVGKSSFLRAGVIPVTLKRWLSWSIFATVIERSRWSRAGGTAKARRCSSSTSSRSSSRRTRRRHRRPLRKCSASWSTTVTSMSCFR